MGADIHIMLEKKLKSKKWAVVNTFTGMWGSQTAYGDGAKFDSAFFNVTRRNYELFSALAGVRGPGPRPRGLPEDVSDLAGDTFADNVDLHSHSWLSVREFMKIWIDVTFSDAEKVAAITERLEGGSSMDEIYESVFKTQITTLYFEEGDGSMDDYRFVFCFDN